MHNPYQQYRQTQVQTAPPEQLVLMLYDGAIRFLEQSRTLMREGKDAGEHLGRAQDILIELMGALNMQAGPIAENLYRLYEYYLTRLVKAYAARDLEVVQEVIQHLRELREAWAAGAAQYRSEQSPATAALGAAPGT